jgi:hypothetical protein
MHLSGWRRFRTNTLLSVHCLWDGNVRAGQTASLMALPNFVSTTDANRIGPGEWISIDVMKNVWEAGNRISLLVRESWEDELQLLEKLSSGFAWTVVLTASTFWMSTLLWMSTLERTIKRTHSYCRSIDNIPNTWSKYLLHYLLTYSMEQGPSWEANSKLCR